MQVVDEAIHAAEEGLTEGRFAIRDLRPIIAVQRSLPELMNSAGHELTDIHKLDEHAPSYQVIVEGKQLDLSLLLQDEFYRIAHELIRNAFTHADASHIEVEIRYDLDQFRLRVRDDGKGIDPKILKAGGISGHFGIPGMRERAQRIGAHLDFSSQEGAGTVVQIAVSASVAYQERHDHPRFRLFHKADKDD
jgi:signal transduction histidine kinase